MTGICGCLESYKRWEYDPDEGLVAVFVPSDAYTEAAGLAPGTLAFMDVDFLIHFMTETRRKIKSRTHELSDIAKLEKDLRIAQEASDDYERSYELFASTSTFPPNLPS